MNNIISNNCLGGYIYQHILHQPYQNPFIWSLFYNPDSYIDMIDHWSDINFANIQIGKDGDEMTNNWYIKIDNQYKVNYIHVVFSATTLSPSITPHKTDGRPKTLVGENIYYCKPWEYIAEKYISRLKRMLVNTHTLFCFYEPNLNVLRLQELPNILQRHNYHGIIFTDNKAVIPNENTYVLPSLGMKLPSEICNHYQQELTRICK